jgi:glycerate 2-kinase
MMIIKNRPELSTTRPRDLVLSIVEAGIERVLPETIMSASLKYDSALRVLSIDGTAFALSRGRTFVVGGGKASGAMAELLENVLGRHEITAGVVTTKRGEETFLTERITVLPAGHPVPDRDGVTAVERMLDLKTRFSIGSGDTIICLISGGGSALMPCPVNGVTLEDKQNLTRLLLASGASISEINCIRKHLSRTKGGQLGRYFAPATVLSIILSDVIGNDLSVIASGPTYPDPSTFSDALRVLRKYGLADSAPGGVMSYLNRGSTGDNPETPVALDNCRNFIIGDLRVALTAMTDKAEMLGLHPFLVSAGQSGETSEAARLRAQEILQGKYQGFDTLVLGGETTPRLPPVHGKGGRNQQYAAASLLEMQGYPGDWTLASVGTDGSDFIAETAGAIVDQSTAAELASRGANVADHVARYDSYTLFDRTSDILVKTGNTGTNVGDVVVYLLA